VGGGGGLRPGKRRNLGGVSGNGGALKKTKRVAATVQGQVAAAPPHAALRPAPAPAPGPPPAPEQAMLSFLLRRKGKNLLTAAQAAALQTLQAQLESTDEAVAAAAAAAASPAKRPRLLAGES
jgi:hypothetical protein